jgi:acyl CoA:acetate/3-ketoacid CoA transferase beta subunit
MSVLHDVCWALAAECRDDDVVVVGVGTPMATAAAFLARELRTPGLTIVAGGAVDPPTLDVCDTLLDPVALTRQAVTTLGQDDLLTLVQGGRLTLQFVSPAQVDARGAVNTSRVHVEGGWRRLPGCLAIPDTATSVGRLIAYRVDGGDRFVVERVDHVTGLGREPVLRAARRLTGAGVVAVVTGAGRSEITEHGMSPARPLERAPSDAVELLERVIDPDGVLGLESRAHRAAARAAVQRRTMEHHRAAPPRTAADDTKTPRP